MLYEWDETKRQKNLEKHQLDIATRGKRVYEAPDKLTFDSHRRHEQRWCDVAMIDGELMALTLTYTLRNEIVRFISLRKASRKERRLYYGKDS